MPRNCECRRCRNSLAAAAAVAIALALGGCVAPVLESADDLAGIKSVIVLPMVDAPGPAAKGSGRVVTGEIIGELVRMGRYDVIHVPQKKLAEAIAATGYALSDCYDPAVAGALAKQLKADAAVCGALTHYGTQSEHRATTVLISSGGGTSSTHWIGLNLRLVTAGNGKTVYTGAGWGQSPEGYTAPIREAVKTSFLALSKHFAAAR